MIALSFLRSFMSLLQRSRLQASGPAVRRVLQPRLVSGDAPFPIHDFISVLEGEADIVETLEQAHTVGRGNVEGEIGTGGTGDELALQIDRERRLAVHRHDSLLKGVRRLRRQHDWEQAV